MGGKRPTSAARKGPQFHPVDDTFKDPIGGQRGSVEMVEGESLNTVKSGRFAMDGRDRGMGSGQAVPQATTHMFPEPDAKDSGGDSLAWDARNPMLGKSAKKAPTDLL